MIELRDYQSEATNGVFKYMKANQERHPLIALPTGSGKTLVISDIVERILRKRSDINILILSHRKEIIKQDYNMLYAYLGERGYDVDKILGINSSGLGRRDERQITVAGIQSVYKNQIFRHTDLIIIDEAHLIPFGDGGMYRTFFSGMHNARYLGLTATPFRLGGGYIWGDDPDKLFDCVAIDYTTGKKFISLINAGFLSPIKAYSTDAALDPTNIKTTGGDFNLGDMSDKFDREKLTNAIVDQIIKFGKDNDYKKWLIFAIDIKHAEHITERLLTSGIMANVIHSKMEMDREKVLKEYNAGKYKCIVNVDILTTGFDEPDIDLIAMMRPTKSPVIHVQTLGRGTRPADGKSHCAVLDFAGNLARLGPINSIVPYTKRKGQKGDPVMKSCPKCKLLQHPSVRICECGHKFPFKTNLEKTANAAPAIASETPFFKKVEEVEYKIHDKPGKPNSICVIYHCGLETYREWICYDHGGWASRIARAWTKKHLDITNDNDMPVNVHDLYKLRDQLKVPEQIQIKRIGKYPEIIAHKFHLSEDRNV